MKLPMNPLLLDVNGTEVRIGEKPSQARGEKRFYVEVEDPEPEELGWYTEEEVRVVLDLLRTDGVVY